MLETFKLATFFEGLSVRALSTNAIEEIELNLMLDGKDESLSLPISNISEPVVK